jgi:hypothetical protein
MPAYEEAAALLTAVSGLAYETPNDTTSRERSPKGGRRGTAVLSAVRNSCGIDPQRPHLTASPSAFKPRLVGIEVTADADCVSGELLAGT